LFLDAKFYEISPEVALDRLRQVGGAQMRRPVPPTTEVVAHGRSSHFLVTYVRQEQGDWGFSYARLNRDVSSPGEARESYERFVRLLRGRFGNPAWQQDGSPPMLGFNAGGVMEISVIEERDATGVELMLAEPEGEAE
jgi:hypothetical protein